MKTKTISYISGKLDRSMTPTQSTTEIVLEKVKKAMIHIGKVIISMMENGQKQLIRIEGERMKHIIEAGRKKREKVMYSQWGEPKVKTHHQRVMEAINHYEWMQYQLNSGKL